MVSNGVRFVQLYDYGWDSHGDNEYTSLNHGFKDKCKQMDQPIAALLMDLKQRGMLDETLVVWGSEFGRTPMQENREEEKIVLKVVIIMVMPLPCGWLVGR